MKKTKGFTLIEMIVVLAIIGILMAVLVPTWNYFLMRSNLKSQNSYSKIVFNAAQTQATKYKFMERNSVGIIKNAEAQIAGGGITTEKENELKKAITEEKKKLFMGDGEYYLYWNGEEAYQLKTDGSSIDSTANSSRVTEFAEAVNKVFTHSEETVYKVYVKDYVVESVCCSRSESSDIIGSFPIEQEGRSDDEILDFNLKEANLNEADDKEVAAPAP